MASGRVVAKSITSSERVASLPCLGAKLLYTWLIPHADNLGRLRGDPLEVKVLLFKRDPATVEDVDLWLGQIASAGLIDWYERQGERFISITNFGAHNSPAGNMSKKSELPGPKDKGVEVCANGVRTPFEHRSNAVERCTSQERDGEGELDSDSEKEKGRTDTLGTESSDRPNGADPVPPVNLADHPRLELLRRQAREITS
jgi:hypothetical protein